MNPMRRTLMVLCCALMLYGFSRFPLLQLKHNAYVAGISTSDNLTRTWARSVESSDISYLRFSGPQMGCVGGNSIFVSDAKVINRFLGALRQAIRRSHANFGNRVSTMEVHLKPLSAKPQPAISLRFSAYDSVDCFGPKFQEALDYLGEFQAAKLRKEMSALAPRVRAVQIGTRKFRDPKTVQQLMQAFQKLDKRSYAFTDQTADYDTWFSLILADNSAVEVNPVIAPYTGFGAPPLPQPLWRLYKQTMHSNKMQMR